jgi:hypothetical protein
MTKYHEMWLPIILRMRKSCINDRTIAKIMTIREELYSKDVMWSVLRYSTSSNHSHILIWRWIILIELIWCFNHYQKIRSLSKHAISSSNWRFNDFILGENRETPLWIHKHISQIQKHSASARDAVSKSEAIHISARCTRNRLIVLQHTKLRSLLNLSNALYFCKYDSNRAIFDVAYQIWSESFLKLFQKLRFWCSSTNEH